MNEKIFFGLSVALSFCAWGTLTRIYIWPRVKSLPLAEATRPLLLANVFRFVGMSFLLPGVVATTLPQAFAIPAAFGDLISTCLAWLAFLAARTAFGRSFLWIFNVWGFCDLLFAFYQGVFGKDFLPSQLGAAYFIPTVFVPLLFCLHAVTFALLLRKGER